MIWLDVLENEIFEPSVLSRWHHFVKSASYIILVLDPALIKYS